MIVRGIGETTTGLIAEHIAACAILSLGWRVSMSQQDAVDLVAWDENRFLRVQVKGANLRSEKDRSPVYQMQLGRGSKKKALPTVKDYDLLALVGIQNRRCLFLATEQVQQYTKRISPKRFENPEIEYETWMETLRIIDGRMG